MPSRPQDDHDKLTPHERQVVQALARNESNKEIARYLNLAESTAKIHVQNLLKKLRVQVAIDAGGNRSGEGE